MQIFVRMAGLLLVLLAGIYIGIHTAENNIQRLHGTEGSTEAIQITPKEGKLEISVLGQVVEAKNPAEQVDTKKVLEVKNQVAAETDRLSALGNLLGTGVREGTRGFFDWMFAWLN